MLEEIPKRLADEIRVYAKRQQTRLTIQQLFEFGRSDIDEVKLNAAKFLHFEIPIRLARMTLDLENLPLGLTEMPPVQRILRLYIQSFQDIQAVPHPKTLEDQEKFAQLIEQIKNRHRNVVATMAMGIRELKERKPEEVTGERIQHFLDRFYLSRIGIRMLIGQHIALQHPRRGWSGIICGHSSPSETGQDAAKNAQDLCRLYYSAAPQVEFHGRTELTFTYIPSHLHHMLFELLKNSLRATVETHGEDAKLPPVRVIIAGGSEDVTIKIEDEGGGIPRSGMNRIWTYLYTTAPQPMGAPNGSEEFDAMAGYGYGLPTTRLYARYFGGDLQVISMEGYGTDAYLHLNRLGTHEEALP